MLRPSSAALTLACAAGAAACSAAQSPAPTADATGTRLLQEEPGRNECGVRIDFGSFAMGPDRAAMRAVDRQLSSDPSVLRVTRSASGPEGEHSLCVLITSEEAATRLANRLIRSVPQPTSAPVAISDPSGRHELPAR